MKVYGIPEAVPFAPYDWSNYDPDAERAREVEHKEALRQHLREAGYKGKHTGGIAQFGVADGYAQYMLADGSGAYGRSFLIHLPYGDGWHFQYIANIPKHEIVANIERVNRIAELFGSQASS